MRIPFLLTDLTNGAFAGVCETLQKLWPEHLQELTTQGALDLFAELAGYRDLVELRASAMSCLDSSAHKMPSREEYFRVLAWRAMRRYGVDYCGALTLVKKLPLTGLGIDCHTVEYHQEQWTRRQKEEGRWFIVADEYHHYVNAAADPLAATYHAAGAPPFSFAVLDEARVFVHSRLGDLFSKLPKNYADLLREDAGSIGSESDLVDAFVRETAIPSAIIPFDLAVTQYRVQADSLVIRPVYDVNDQYVGEVLFNTALGGILPVVYSSADISEGRLLSDIKKILRGEALPYSPGVAREKGSPLYISSYALGDVLVSQLRTDVEQGSSEVFPSSFRKRGAIVHSGGCVLEQDGRKILCGESFICHGNQYLRQQTLVTRDVVIEAFPDLSTTLWSGPMSVAAPASCTAAIPDVAMFWLGQAKTSIATGYEYASARLFSDSGLNDALRLLLDVISPTQLVAECHRYVMESFPLQREDGDDQEDVESRLAERIDGTRRLLDHGEKVTAFFPEFASFDAVTLGVVNLFARHQYPGGRNESWAPSFGRRDHRRAFELIGVLLLIGLPGGWKQHEQLWTPETEDLVAILVADILDGRRKIEHLPSALASMKKMLGVIVKQQDLMKAAGSWEEREQERLLYRGQGRYRYIGDAIKTGPVAGLGDLFLKARSSGFAPVVMTQSLSDFELQHT